MGKRKRAENKPDSISENPPKRAPPPVVPEKPLSYESLKTVLQYIDPNKRFQIASAMPSIRRTNWIVPLRIDSLTFGDMSMTVNGTKYQLGVYREFVERHKRINGASYIRDHNELGGATYEVFPCGIQDRSYVPASPGDIEFLDPREPSAEWTRVDYQRKLNELQALCRNHPPQLGRICCGVLAEISLIQRFLKGEQPPFNLLIQLTMTTPDDDETMERFSYTFKLHEAYKKLTTNFFGETSKSIRVKEFYFDRFSMPSTIRLPSGLRFQVEKIKMGFEYDVPLVLDKITPILHLPTLRCLQVVADEGNKVRHPIIENNVEQLIIRDIYIDKIDILNSHKNIKLLRWDYPKLDSLINHWIEIQREIGSSFTVTFWNQDDALNVLNGIKKKDFNFRLKEDRKVTISVNGVSEIQLRIEEPDLNAENDRWSIRMEMVSIGTE